MIISTFLAYDINFTLKTVWVCIKRQYFIIMSKAKVDIINKHTNITSDRIICLPHTKKKIKKKTDYKNAFNFASL